MEGRGEGDFGGGDWSMREGGEGKEGRGGRKGECVTNFKCFMFLFFLFVVIWGVGRGVGELNFFFYKM